MKVHNLTDIATPRLVQHGLVAQSFAVGRVLLAPGESVDVPAEEQHVTTRMLEHLLELGACAVDTPPEAYRLAREKAHVRTVESIPLPEKE